MTIIWLATLKTKQNKANNLNVKVRHHPSPQGESGTTPLYGGGRDVQLRHTAKKTKPPNPPPVGKAGFEVWVLSKGGLVSVHHRRPYRTVVHVHPLGRYAEP